MITKYRINQVIVGSSCDINQKENIVNFNTSLK